MLIQNAPVKFGTLTLEQRKKLDVARNNGYLSVPEAILYKQLAYDVFAQPRREPMASGDSDALVNAIKGMIRWGMMSKMSDAFKAESRQKLDNVRELLLSAPFEATDAVVDALAAEYGRIS